MRLSRLAADLLLISVAAVWGGTFVIVRHTVQSLPPLLLIGARFALALIALLLVSPRSLLGWRRHLLPGLALGGLLMGGFILQTYGLRYAAASVSGFITGLNVVFVAVIAALFMPGGMTIRVGIGVLLATLGLTALSWQEGAWRLGPGDLLTLGCAVFFALHIVMTGKFAPSCDPFPLAGIQFAAVGACCLILNALAGGGFVLPRASDLAALAYLGLAATGFAFLVQTAAQRHTPPVDTAIILSTEPLFAAIVAVTLGGEKVTARMLLGGGAILAAMLVSVMEPRPAHPVAARLDL